MLNVHQLDAPVKVVRVNRNKNEPGRKDEVEYLLMFPMIAMKLEDLTNDNYRSERILTS